MPRSAARAKTDDAVLPAQPAKGAKGGLAGVSPNRARVLRDLGVETLSQLLEYFPRDYQIERGGCQQRFSERGLDNLARFDHRFAYRR